jgi:hypothetical protein
MRLRIAECGMRIDESNAVFNPQSATRNPQSVSYQFLNEGVEEQWTF